MGQRLDAAAWRGWRFGRNDCGCPMLAISWHPRVAIAVNEGGRGIILHFQTLHGADGYRRRLFFYAAFWFGRRWNGRRHVVIGLGRGAC